MKLHKLFVLVFLTLGLLSKGTMAAPESAPMSVAVPKAVSSVQSVQALIGRLLPKQAGQFVCEIIPADNGQDVFELESKGGKIILRGNSALSLSFGLNWYLKYTCHGSVSLNGNQLDLPNTLPPVVKTVRLSAWAKYRYINNYCTFGYSTPWWDWAQWETFIDWMALNGINAPLAVTGQEAVWQAVGRRFGMTEAEIDAFLPGPPYLPFCWMGCLDGWGGPLPKEWIPRHVELGQKILARERELGMTPVLQGFTGHIPEAIVKKHPGTKVQKIHWCGYATLMLDPADPLFQPVASAFIEEQTKLFGSDHLYDADSFIEMTPPSGDLTYLASTSRAIYEGMAKADPQAVWLLQGWTFMNQASFWKQDRVKAFLDAVPNEHMLILDLFCESRPVWNQTQGFYGKPWVWSNVYNFGNNTILGASGSLERFQDLSPARQHPLGQNLRGVGLLMEGYDHNPLIFDIMFELAWRDRIELKPWMKDYAWSRYGQPNADAQAAWETLRVKAYSHGVGGNGGRTVLTAFPSTGCGGHRYPVAALSKAWSALLRAQNDLGQTATYQHDLVNVARQALSSQAAEWYDKTMAAYQAKDAAAYRHASGEFMQLLRDMDELLATNEGFLLGKWLADARRWGATDAERAKMEWNARRIVTLWTPGARLRDYAWKEWSGMLIGFYGKRWEIFFRHQQQALDAGKAFDQVACNAELFNFENDWANQQESYSENPSGDSIKVAQRLFDKYMANLSTTKNLTTGQPVTCSFSLPGMEADLANDGIIDTESFWGTDVAKDKDAWWQVDLGQVAAVARVVVVGYYGDQRNYGFIIEGSLDSKTWIVLADRRDNPKSSTRTGYECKFNPVQIRHLRLNMTSNSVNTGRHLVEVLAFGE
jgi:alpha-N-acetylglucosaminidase